MKKESSGLFLPSIPTNKTEEACRADAQETKELGFVVEPRLAQASSQTHYSRREVSIEYTHDRDKKNAVPLIIQDYRLIRTIGSGSTGKVKLAEHVQTGEQIAIKVVPRLHTTKGQRSKESIVSRERRILREAAILYLVDHPNIVQLKDLVITDDYFFLLFEHIQGQELLDHICDRKKLSERRAKCYLGQLLSAISYCHAYGIVHRDLKIENVIIVDPQKENPVVKLVDFGLSNFYHPRHRLTTYCGSLYFAAPELLSGRPYCGPEIDIWSLGVIMYVMLAGKVPFDDPSLTALHSKIKRGIFSMPSDISPVAQDLLRGMLCVEPENRLRLSQVINHPWFEEGSRCISRVYAPADAPINHLNDAILDHLMRDFAPLQFDGTKGILKTLKHDNYKEVHDHPLLKLYHLAESRMQKKSTSAEKCEESKQRSTSLEELMPALIIEEEAKLQRSRSKSFTETPPRLALHSEPKEESDETRHGLQRLNQAGNAEPVKRKKKKKWYSACGIQ